MCRIEQSAFNDCSCLFSLKIPDSITTIGNSAFLSFGPTSLTLPHSVTIGSRAFQKCDLITSFTLSGRLTKVSSYTFLAAVGSPPSLCQIRSERLAERFLRMLGLRSLVLPHAVDDLGAGTSRHCSGLTFVQFPKKLTQIGSYTFSDCTGLTSIKLPSIVTSIGFKAFFGCTGLTSFAFPHAFKFAQKNAFMG